MSQRSYFEHLQHGGFPATSGSKNKINMASQAVIDDDVFDKLRFVNEIWTQIPSQIGEERRIHGLQDTAAVIHGERWGLGDSRDRRIRTSGVRNCQHLAATKLESFFISSQRSTSSSFSSNLLRSLWFRTLFAPTAACLHVCALPSIVISNSNDLL